MGSWHLAPGVLRVAIGGILSGLTTTVGFQRAAAACVNDSDCNDSRNCTENICDNGTCKYPPKP